jgi:hypothetical protein
VDAGAIAPDPLCTMRTLLRNRWTRWTLLGREVVDGTGLPLGSVVDTYPFDGGEVELAVVRLDGTFGGRRMIRVEDLEDAVLALRTPFARWQVEDSPPLSGGRHGADDPERAKGYWRFAEPDVMLRAAA